MGKARIPDHPPPIFVNHHISLTIYKVRWLNCSCEDW